MKPNDVVAILHKGSSLHAARSSSNLVALVALECISCGLKVETTPTTPTTTTSLCICIYCSPHAFAFSYGSLLYTEKPLSAKPLTAEGALPYARSMIPRSINHGTREKVFSVIRTMRHCLATDKKNAGTPVALFYPQIIPRYKEYIYATKP